MRFCLNLCAKVQISVRKCKRKDLFLFIFQTKNDFKQAQRNEKKEINILISIFFRTFAT